MRRIIYLIAFMPVVVYAQKFRIAEKPSEKKIDVYYGSKLISSFIYFDSLYKTAYYPISTITGTHITREYPYVKKAGERTDHPHHIGLFFAHQSVNGHDFWNMSTAIAPEKRNRYGTEVFKSVATSTKKKYALITSKVTWRSNEGPDLLNETTAMKFSAAGQDLIIDRTTKLEAITEVTFKDEKDALLGLRVARELELPVEGKDRFVLPDGSVSAEAIPNDISKVTGNYRNSESVIGEAVWGKKATWVVLDGKINGKDISVAIIDSPDNVEHPSYWHARGYGLFAVNPLGKEVFTEGKAKLNLVLQKGESVTFRYRIVIREGGQLTPAELNQHLKLISENK
ncbi:MAG TPA: PmoA family protein [Cyclobacteriaceae bacterium]|nr:PmoA family protein [Cyclobacteriaceae bacterium]